jgi:hypothetical protein
MGSRDRPPHVHRGSRERPPYLHGVSRYRPSHVNNPGDEGSALPCTLMYTRGQANSASLSTRGVETSILPCKSLEVKPEPRTSVASNRTGQRGCRSDRVEGAVLVRHIPNKNRISWNTETGMIALVPGSCCQLVALPGLTCSGNERSRTCGRHRNAPCIWIFGTNTMTILCW